jgi:Sulfotransferase domain
MAYPIRSAVAVIFEVLLAGYCCSERREKQADDPAEVEASTPEQVSTRRSEMAHLTSTAAGAPTLSWELRVIAHSHENLANLPNASFPDCVRIHVWLPVLFRIESRPALCPMQSASFFPPSATIARFPSLHWIEWRGIIAAQIEGTGGTVVLPNFLIIGAAKAGTTSLWHYLRQHPEVFMSEVKEPNFFRTHKDSHLWVTDTLESYERLFEGSERFKAVGEASKLLADEQAVHRIKAMLPNVKLVAILRDPYLRAFSEFTFHRMTGKEPIGHFLRAIEADASRPVDQRIDYIGHSLYYRNLSRYFAVFPSERIKVVFNDDLRRDPQMVVSSIFSFLDVDPFVSIDTKARLTVSGIPRVRALHWLLGPQNPMKEWIGPMLPPWARNAARRLKNANLQRQSITPEQRAALWEYFEDDITHLEQLLGVQLDLWRAA